MIEITLKEGFIENFNLLPETASINGEFVNDPEDMNDFILNFSAYKVQDGVLVKDLEKFENIQLERAADEIRERRQTECFVVVDRSKLWYDSLSSEQLAELKIWYEEWLDAPNTGIIPTAPSWL